MKIYEVRNARLSFSNGERLHEGDTLTDEDLERLVDYKYARKNLIARGHIVVVGETEPEPEPAGEEEED